MPKYCGINGEVREIVSQYCGVDGEVRKIKEEYCGVDGEVRKIFGGKEYIIKDGTKVGPMTYSYIDTSSGSGKTGVASWATVNENSGSISIYNGSWVNYYNQGFTTTNKIDLSKYSKLCIECTLVNGDGSTSSSARLRALTVGATGAFTNSSYRKADLDIEVSSAVQTNSVDISSLTEELYIHINVLSSSHLATLTIYNLWLE